MDKHSIILENICKKYKLYDSIKSRMKELLPGKSTYHEEFWALNNINLTIPKGHTVGIVGRNGSGKSTLLKLITSIIKPTSGTIEVNGKVAALLELGSGFNAEFTGIQNIILNCTLMGLSQDQIDNNLASIEKFADIGTFIHQPLRTYSSGMRARLAFATAIHVDPDILIVDEALAVGDAKFQQKCYQKFLDFQEEGKTILLVTHDIHVVPRYCNLAVLLDSGTVLAVDEPKKVVSMYSELIMCGSIKDESKTEEKATPLNKNAEHKLSFIDSDQQMDTMFANPLYNNNEYRFGNNKAKIINFMLESNNSINPSIIKSGQWANIYLKILFLEEIQSPLIGISIKTKDGVLLYAINTRFLKLDLPPESPGKARTYKFSLKLDLHPGDWFLDLGIADKLFSEDLSCDIRNNSIHLQISQHNSFDGLTMLPTKFQEVSEINAIEVSE